MKKALRISTLITLTLAMALLAGCGQDITAVDENADTNSKTTVLRSANSEQAEVKLLMAETYVTSHYGFYAEHLQIRVRIKDIAYDKDVRLWILADDGTWKESGPGYYKEDCGDGYEIWTINATISDSPYAGVPEYRWAKPYKFAVRYKANGNTYWDNNNGQNYTMGLKDGEKLGKGINVLKERLTAYYSDHAGKVAFYGTVLVRNLAYHKNVKIVYTTDNWATTRTADCRFSGDGYYSYGNHVEYPNVHGVENWSFNISLESNVTDIAYAIAYDVDGETYWDNNMGENYKLEVKHY